NALEEGTPRNGIRTAIEDFLAESGSELVFRDVVGLHGLAILVPPARLEENDDLLRRLEELDSPAWLKEPSARIEQARLLALAVPRLEAAPTVVEAERGALWRVVDLLVGILADVAHVEVSRLVVEREPPRVAQAVRVDLVQTRLSDERVRGR